MAIEDGRKSDKLIRKQWQGHWLSYAHRILKIPTASAQNDLPTCYSKNSTKQVGGLMRVAVSHHGSISSHDRYLLISNDMVA